MILMIVLWVVVTFNYYMISFQVKYFPGNFSTNTIVMFGADVLSFLLSSYLIAKFDVMRIITFNLVQMSLAGAMIVLFIDVSDPGCDPGFHDCSYAKILENANAVSSCSGKSRGEMGVRGSGSS